MLVCTMFMEVGVISAFKHKPSQQKLQEEKRHLLRAVDYRQSIITSVYLVIIYLVIFASVFGPNFSDFILPALCVFPFPSPTLSTLAFSVQEYLGRISDNTICCQLFL